MNAKRKTPKTPPRIAGVLDDRESGDESASKGGRGDRSKATPKRAQGGSDAADDDRRRKVSYYVRESLIEELRDAVDFLAGPPERATVSGLVEQSIRRELDRLARKYNGGDRFPPRPAELRPGRKAGR